MTKGTAQYEMPDRAEELSCPPLEKAPEGCALCWDVPKGQGDTIVGANNVHPKLLSQALRLASSSKRGAKKKSEKLARSTGQSRLFPAKSRLKTHLYFLQNKSCKQKGNRET